MERSRIEWLTQRLLSGLAESREQEEYFAWVRSEKDNEQITEILQQEWERFENKHTLSAEKNQQLFQSILDAAKLLQEDEPAQIISFFHWKRWAAVAAILLLLLTSGYFFLFKKDKQHEEIVKIISAKDVPAPETNKATITLANGKIIYLDSINNGTISTANNVTVVKTADGKIIYSGNADEILYNTLRNPRGSKVIDITLSDGSKVWLNAGSSVTYPIAFIGNERKVTITGEAYFEVAHNASTPFKVTKDEMEVTVLGTHFNVNAYDDESDIRVTLLEGSVKINKGNDYNILKPGQQAQVDNYIKVASNVGLEEVMAWKEGNFHFESADIQTILRQFARWYDIEIVYEGPVKKRKFFTIVKRSSSLKSVLELLQDNEIVYRIEGKKLIVKSG